MGRTSRVTTPAELRKGKKVLTPDNPYEKVNYNTLKPAFSFEYMQPKYCLSNWEPKQIKKLIKVLVKFEGKTWAEIHSENYLLYSKVNKKGIKVSIPDFITPDMDIYYIKPFGSNNSYRVFGIRKGHNFKFLWFDDKHEIYPGQYR